GRDVESRDRAGQEANGQPWIPRRKVEKERERLDGLQAVGPRNQPGGKLRTQHSFDVLALSGTRQDDVRGIALAVEVGEERAQAYQRSGHPDAVLDEENVAGSTMAKGRHVHADTATDVVVRLTRRRSARATERIGPGRSESEVRAKARTPEPSRQPWR